MLRFKTRYLVLLAFCALLVAPGSIFAIFYGGGYTPPEDWPSLVIDLAFILPLPCFRWGFVSERTDPTRSAMGGKRTLRFPLVSVCTL